VKCQNCLTCKYANINNDSSVTCDINLLLDGRLSVIDSTRIEKNCVCHSDIPKEEFRYGFDNKYMKKSYDACEHCQRIVKNSKDIKKIITNETNSTKPINVCSICINKYFQIGD